MHHIQVSKKTLTDRLKSIHRHSVEQWKKAGANDRKPKLYETTDRIVQMGLEEHERASKISPDTISER